MLFKPIQKFWQRLRDWEHWPFYLFYFPISYAWPYYFLRSRSLWFYTGSNPTLALGGFEGERKTVMYRQMPPELCPLTLSVRPGEAIEAVRGKVAAAGLDYPFIVKPDIGMKGLLFRVIRNAEQLEHYHRQMPADYLVQEFLDWPHEVSVFYCRRFDEQKGRITAFIQKDLLVVKGDGRSSLLQLAARHPYAKTLLPKVRTGFGAQAQEVLKEGEEVCLSHVANLFNGARFIDLGHLVTPKMQELFDAISHQADFGFGRYDIKCRSIEDIREGRSFKILEFNGAGSVPNHIYTGTYGLLGAYREILRHWEALFRISESARKKGFRYWGLVKGYRFLQRSKKHFNRLKALDEKLVL